MVTIRSVTLATTNTEAMVRFYDRVLGAGLEPIDGAPAGFHRGRLGGIDLVVCPNEIAGVVAEQNRQQFCFEVDDVTATLALAVAAGGEILDDGEDHGAVSDPDGNSIEFVRRG